MGFVQYALKFRITFYVMSILILLAGVGAYFMMPKDVLPQVNIPVVTVVWTFTGLDTPEAIAALNEVPIKVVNGTPS